jgi:hypothetical protein
MASIGTNLGNAVSDVIKWLAAAVKKLGELITAGDSTNSGRHQVLPGRGWAVSSDRRTGSAPEELA